MIVLGITDTLKPSLQLYLDWIHRADAGIEIVLLSSVRQNLDDLARCDGLVLSGGSDIHPKFYGREDAMHLVENVNEPRDQFEFSIVTEALEARMPILGICRGMQVFNVALGGSMIPDVQTAGYQNHRKEKTVEPRHTVRIVEGSQFRSIAGIQEGEVNTNHHQAVDTLGRGLRATAYSPDGLVEGLELEHPEAFLQLVQWHPERMPDFENPLSGGLLMRFISEVQAAKEHRHNHLSSHKLNPL